MAKGKVRKSSTSDGDKVARVGETQQASRLMSGDPEFATTIRVAEDFMRRYRNALRDLAN